MDLDDKKKVYVYHTFGFGTSRKWLGYCQSVETKSEATSE